MLLLLIGIAGAIVVFDAVHTEKPILVAVGKIWTMLNIVAGVAVLLAARPLLDFALRSRTGHMVDETFCIWAMGKFDRFLTGSLIVTGLLLWGMLWVVRQKNEKEFVWRHLCGVGYGCMAALLAVSVWYGIGTVNKWFDLAAWIGVMALAECGVLQLPFFLRLRQAKLQKNPV